jgi:hypothetical protein
MASAFISAEEFASWREDPVTQWVLSACAKAAEQNRETWIAASWDAGQVDPLLRTELFTRADAYLALAETQYEGWAKTHGEEVE